MECTYCGRKDNEMALIQEAVKPKGYPYRWKTIGHCCWKCEQEGKPVKITKPIEL